MKNSSKPFVVPLILCLFMACMSEHKKDKTRVAFNFDNSIKNGDHQFIGDGFSFVEGLDGKALNFSSDKKFGSLSLENLFLDGTKDFSIQCWVKTNADNPMVFLSQKDFDNKSISAQKNTGWVLYSSGGALGWSVGSGKRRINYERDNGSKMPINDGVWHQITMTFNKETSEFRLYYDGLNKAIYKVYFDFFNNKPLVIGTAESTFNYDDNFSSDIESGREHLQAFVDAFNNLGLKAVKDNEFLDLIVSPKDLLESKLKQFKGGGKPTQEDISKVLDLRGKLRENAYTVFQNKALTTLKPISKIYALQEGRVVINKLVGKSFTEKEKLFPSNFSMDNLVVWERVVSSEEILKDYNDFKKEEGYNLEENLDILNVGVWNIWHGGIHWNKEKDGWDSRLRIVEMIKEKNLDIILMQETYSSGDFIAAELGYYYATTSDWDYCYQGANISVLSRYPIKEVQVLEKTAFNNVAVKLSVSKTQDIWAMSNWYGMAQFSDVYEFHRSRFENSDLVPVFFGGDFNAVPHTDGGKSPASEKMLASGFTDAYRNLFPDVEAYPGFTHRGDFRIDQLYYKGKGIKNEATEVISTWPTGFPSDHFLIVSKFQLN